MEWISFQDEILYLQILYFMIKGLIFYYPLTQPLLSLTLSLAENLMPTHTHTHSCYVLFLIIYCSL